jgi:hypothetical protein
MEQNHLQSMLYHLQIEAVELIQLLLVALLPKHPSGVKLQPYYTLKQI